MGPFVDAFDGQRSLLQRARVLPQSLTGRWFQDGDSVRQRWSVNPVALRAASETDLAFSFAADLVAEEGTRFQQVVT